MRIAASRSATLRCTPRRTCSIVRSANHRSIRFKTRPVGGREVHVGPWALGHPALDQGRLVRAVVVQNEVDSQADGHGGVARVEELLTLINLGKESGPYR